MITYTIISAIKFMAAFMEGVFLACVYMIWTMLKWIAQGLWWALKMIGRLFGWIWCKITGHEYHRPAYSDGFEFEEYVAKCLSRKGYSNVEVTPKSGDYGADIIATDKHGERVCFQCKKYSKPVGIKAVQEVSSARTYHHCNKAAVVTNSTYTRAAANLASAENVALFDIAYFE